MTRTDVRDEYAEDGETVVLLDDGRVYALAPVPSAVLALLASGPRRLVELTADLIAEFGAPPGDPDGVETVTGVVNELAEIGLVALSDPVDGP